MLPMDMIYRESSGFRTTPKRSYFAMTSYNVEDTKVNIHLLNV